jgi:hypothetical protein
MAQEQPNSVDWAVQNAANSAVFDADTARRRTDEYMESTTPTYYGGGQDAADAQQARFSELGRQATTRQAYAQNFGDYQAGMAQANGSRGAQNDALSLQRGAALGSAPSQAEILGKSMADQGIASQMAMAASARGGAQAQAEAQRNARGGQAAYMQQAQNTMAGLRADEMANARGAYMSGASAIRGQDLGAAGLGLSRTGMETQNEQFQRAQNQQGQLAWEGLGVHTQDSASQAAIANRNASATARMAEQQRNAEMARTGIGVAAGVAGGAFAGAIPKKTTGSDENLKASIATLFGG